MRRVRLTVAAAAVALLTSTTAACNDDNATGADPNPSVSARMGMGWHAAS